MEILDGRYYGAGEKNLFVKISGLGDPPVVIEPGLGSLSLEWQGIHEELAKHTSVISYDRMGFGESPVGSKPRDSYAMADELFEMLGACEAPGPYIFVTSSNGGLITLHFAKLFPHMVAGIVFVDSMTIYEPEFDKLDTPVYKEKFSTAARIEGIKKLLELGKEEFEQQVGYTLSKLYEDFPVEYKNMMSLYQSDKNFYQTICDEFDAIPDSIEAIKHAGLLPDIPVKVLCRDFEVMLQIAKEIELPENEARMIEEQWLENSKELMRTFRQSEFKIVKGSTLQIHVTRPDAIIVETLDLIKTLKS